MRMNCKIRNGISKSKYRFEIALQLKHRSVEYSPPDFMRRAASSEIRSAFPFALFLLLDKPSFCQPPTFSHRIQSRFVAVCLMPRASCPVPQKDMAWAMSNINEQRKRGTTCHNNCLREPLADSSSNLFWPFVFRRRPGLSPNARETSTRQCSEHQPRYPSGGREKNECHAAVTRHLAH